MVNDQTTFWGITAFFNPVGYGNKLENYRFFRASSKSQGLKLLCVELAFDDDPFVLSQGSDAEILLQIRGSRLKNFFWQKERLLNLGLAQLPMRCDKVCWVDSDLLFENAHWVEESSRLLDTHTVIQPFENVIRLPKGAMVSPDLIPRAGLIHQRTKGFRIQGEVGFVWAARRKFLERVSFYESLPTGGQDIVFARSIVRDKTVDKWLRRYSSREMRVHEEDYISKVGAELKGTVSNGRGTILHLWHGTTKDRLYVMRWKILKLFSFDPNQDIRIGENGILEWATPKKELHQAIREYFGMRNEDGNSMHFGLRLKERLDASQCRLGFLERCVGAVRGFSS